jgi:HSP20 family molecular chaperone IbpA
MTRMSHLTSPLFLGFEEMERLIDRVGKGGDGYPPYNIERITAGGDGNGPVHANAAADLLRITLAVAGFKPHQIEITVEENQLNIRGRQEDDKSRHYIHRGIAARQFSRTFVLADGIEVKSADLNDGLLSIDLVRRQPERSVRKIEIGKVHGRPEGREDA